MVSKTGRRWCKTCRNIAKKKWRDVNWEEKEKLGVKNSKMLSRYGISLEEYKDKLKAQGNLCALCRQPFKGDSCEISAPALDHNHNTNILREFIHNSCNRGLGLFRDNPRICRLAAEYLERHGEHNVQS
jgi:hypothetical protein